MNQPDLFGASSAPKRSARPDPAEVRRRLEAVLDLLRDSQSLPWTEDELRFHRTVVPQMTNWLEPQDADAMKREFQSHLERLSAA